MFHFHRMFKTLTGLTPREYALAHVGKQIRNKLDNSETVTEAIYDAGYRSNGRFYEISNEVLGMTPTNYRADGAVQKYVFAESALSVDPRRSKRTWHLCHSLGDDPDELARDLQKVPACQYYRR